MKKLFFVSVLSFLITTQMVVAQQVQLQQKPAYSLTPWRSDIWPNADALPGVGRMHIIVSDAEDSKNQSRNYIQDGNDTILRYASFADLVADYPDLQKAVQEVCSLGEEGKLAAHMKYVCFGKNGFWQVTLDFGGR